MTADLPSKEAVERWQLERFASMSKLIDLSVMRAGKPPEPDFITTDSRLGIDFTALHVLPPTGEQPRQAQDSYRAMIVSRAQRVYEAKQLPAVRASVHFADGQTLTKAHVEPLAFEIVRLVADHVPFEAGMQSEVNRGTTRGLPDGLHSIRIYNTVGMSGTHFPFNGSAWQVPLTREDVQRALDAKAPKLALYRTRCESAWLVINTDDAWPSTWFSVDPTILQPPFRSSFDRGFLALGFGNKVHELLLIKPT